MKKWMTRMMCFVFCGVMILLTPISTQARTNETPIKESKVKKDIVTKTISVSETFGTARYKISFKAKVARERYYIGKKLTQIRYDGIKKIVSKPTYTKLSTGSLNNDLWRRLKKNKKIGPIIRKYHISFPKIFRCKMRSVKISNGLTKNGYIHPFIEANYCVIIKFSFKYIGFEKRFNLRNTITFERNGKDLFQPIYYEYYDEPSNTTSKRYDISIK